MRRTIFFTALAAMVAVSCVKESADPIQKTVLEAVAAGAETKTVLTEGTKTWWDQGDAISVFDAQKNNLTFNSPITGPCVTASFIYEGAFEHPETLWAFYPQNSDITTSDFNTFTGFDLPDVQSAIAGTFDPEAALAYGTSTTKQVKFHNMTALVKFTVAADADEIYTVKMVAEGDKLAGEAVFDGTELSASGSSQVILKGAMREGNTYYMAVAPGTYTSLKVYVNGVELEGKAYANKTLKAGTIYDIKEITNPRTISIVDQYTVTNTASTITEADVTCDYVYWTDYSVNNPFVDGWAWIGTGKNVYLVSSDGGTLTNPYNQYGDVNSRQSDERNGTDNGQFYAILYQYYGLPMYFNIDWEGTYDSAANVYPLADVQDRNGDFNKVVLNRSYYSEEDGKLVIDLALLEGTEIKLIHGTFSK